MARVARLRVDADVLLGALGLPEGLRVERVRACHEVEGVVEFVLDGECFAEVAPGARIPRVGAVFTDGAFERFVEVEP